MTVHSSRVVYDPWVILDPQTQVQTHCEGALYPPAFLHSLWMYVYVCVCVGVVKATSLSHVIHSGSSCRGCRYPHSSRPVCECMWLYGRILIFAYMCIYTLKNIDSTNITSYIQLLYISLSIHTFTHIYNHTPALTYNLQYRKHCSSGLHSAAPYATQSR
jgi:hypothetical protein